MSKSASIDLKNLAQGTNILELIVPALLETTLDTGMDFLNDSFGGTGMTPSSAMLLTGTPGAGKTTMLLQLADKLTERGHIVLFNTVEESLLQVRKVTKRLQLKHGFICGQDRMIGDAIKHCKKLKKLNPRKQVFFLCDSLQVMDDGKYKSGHTNANSALRVINEFTAFCKSETDGYPIGIMIGQVNKDGEFAGKQTVKHEVDIHGHIYIDMMKSSETYGERIFSMQKNRFGCNGRQYILGLSEKGIVEKGQIN
jgi:DNA repair protein RadA/Sms